MKEIKTIGIIGYGHFGKFLHEIIKKEFPSIKIKLFSRSRKINNRNFYSLENVADSDILFIAVSISSIKNVIEDIKGMVKKDTIIVDISTVKEFPEKELKKNSNIKYICTHPMFGPFSYKKIGNKLDGLKIVLTGNNLKKTEYIFIKKLLRKMKLDVIEMTSEKHDKMLAETLFLTHFVSQIVVKAGYERTKIDTVSFGFMMHAVESVKNDTELFKDVYKYNKYCKTVIKNFEQSIKKVKKDILKK